MAVISLTIALVPNL